MRPKAVILQKLKESKHVRETFYVLVIELLLDIREKIYEDTKIQRPWE
jgi:hypothetical protein